MTVKLNKLYLKKLKNVFEKYFKQVKKENKKPDKSIDWVWQKIKSEL